MKAEITKIDELKASAHYPVAFRRIYFKMEDGSWAVTDVVPSYRNYRYWKPVIEAGVGTTITNVRLKEKSKVDADSPVKIVPKPPVEPRPEGALF